MGQIENSAFFSLSYGLFVITAKDGDKDNGCIANTVMQVTNTPNQISLCLNKGNHTTEMIQKTGVFNVSVLTQSTPFSIFEHFGFQSGRTVDKFAKRDDETSENGLRYIGKYSNAMMSAQVVQTVDCGTHLLFIATVTEALSLQKEPSLTYQYYFDHVKPRPQEAKKVGYVCKICGYFHEGETLPDDFICPLCKHGAADFEKA